MPLTLIISCTGLFGSRQTCAVIYSVHILLVSVSRVSDLDFFRLIMYGIQASSLSQQTG